jgi:hypothetical protein
MQPHGLGAARVAGQSKDVEKRGRLKAAELARLGLVNVNVADAAPIPSWPCYSHAFPKDVTPQQLRQPSPPMRGMAHKSAQGAPSWIAVPATVHNLVIQRFHHTASYLCTPAQIKEAAGQT